MDIASLGIVRGSQRINKLVADPREFTIERTKEKIYKILLIAI